MIRSRSLAFIAVLAVLLVACGNTTSDSPSDEPPASVAASVAAEPSEAAEPSDEGSGGRQVTLTDFAFSEGELTIPVGSTVTFLNGGSAPHTATEGTDGVAADDASFNEQLAPGDEAEVTIDEAGTYEVTCLLHPQMNMTIVVEG